MSARTADRWWDADTRLSSAFGGTFPKVPTLVRPDGWGISRDPNSTHRAVSRLTSASRLAEPRRPDDGTHVGRPRRPATTLYRPRCAERVTD
ncbi:hypothetical protein C441_15160 [Haloferax sulfurifontis ATCC BAA-897]|uniref:Uncharacterized protein n=1 Tax=Haloferax sulfurifontis ATCC BAA-897 TaxID=662480 RepID=M0I2U7_9EURY|nr:hypothetical protein C441_15160 [Haloferax sulfurifontis ATCC BAA-897]